MHSSITAQGARPGPSSPRARGTAACVAAAPGAGAMPRAVSQESAPEEAAADGSCRDRPAAALVHESPEEERQAMAW